MHPIFLLLAVFFIFMSDPARAGFDFDRRVSVEELECETLFEKPLRHQPVLTVPVSSRTALSSYGGAVTTQRTGFSTRIGRRMAAARGERM